MYIYSMEVNKEK